MLNNGGMVFYQKQGIIHMEPVYLREIHKDSWLTTSDTKAYQIIHINNHRDAEQSI